MEIDSHPECETRSEAQKSCQGPSSTSPKGSCCARSYLEPSMSQYPSIPLSFSENCGFRPVGSLDLINTKVTKNIRNTCQINPERHFC